MGSSREQTNVTSSHEWIDLHAVDVLVEVDIDVGVGEDEAAHADVRPRTGPEGRVAGRVIPVNSLHDTRFDQLFDEPASKRSMELFLSYIEEYLISFSMHKLEKITRVYENDHSHPGSHF